MIRYGAHAIGGDLLDKAPFVRSRQRNLSSMCAVWSLWTKPLGRYGSIWASFVHYLFSWVLSVELARQHFGNTVLVTDDAGASLLLDGIGLQFDQVSLELNGLSSYDPQWFTLGKIHAYRIQEAPFVHIDHDVFLWHSLPSPFMSAALLAQNPEPFVVGQSGYYFPHELEAFISSQNGWFPDVWIRQPAREGFARTAVNCGIFGGNQLDFIRDYGDTAFRVLDHPRNVQALSGLEHKAKHMIVLEQYILGLCLDKYRSLDQQLTFNSVIDYLFKDSKDAFSSGADVGYTHLIGNSKNDRRISYKLARRIACQYPKFFSRCINYARYSDFRYRNLIGL